MQVNGTNLAAAMFLALAGYAETTAATSTVEDYRSWYQVEIIIFAQKNPPEKSETWPLVPLSYPSNILSIEPADPSRLFPLTLAQARELLAWEALSGAEAVGEPINTERFMFENRSRYKVSPTPEPESAPEPEPMSDAATAESGASSPGLPLEATGASQSSAIDLANLFVVNKPIAFQSISEDERVLARYARSVNRSSLYRLLLHEAWRQPVNSAENAQPILIQAGDRYGQWFELDGTISISRSRYLHLDTDLWFTEFTPVAQPLTQISAEAIDSEVEARFPELVRWAETSDRFIPVHSHRLVQSRRMRSATLHFLDHPYFGVLIRIDDFSHGPETNLSSD